MSFPRHPDEITIDWLTGALGASPGDILSHSVRFVGDAIGNTSDVYFIQLNTRDGAGLPESVVAKMIPQFEGAIEIDLALRLFEREIEVYRNVVAETPIRAPALLWSDYDPETSLGLLLMEDCSHFDNLDQTLPEPTSIEDLQNIFDAAASLHARWWNVNSIPTGVLAAGDPTRSAFNHIVTEGWRALMAGGPGIETIPGSGLAASQLFTDHFMELTERHWPTEHLTVTHLDFRVDNMFFDATTREPVIFDWQGASMGRGAYDIAYLLSTGYVPEFRRRHEKALLERYHAHLLEAGVKGYSINELWYDYRVGLMFSLWVVPFTVILDLSSERGQALISKVLGIYDAISDHDSDVAFREMLTD